jgi:hypothetical protein
MRLPPSVAQPSPSSVTVRPVRPICLRGNSPIVSSSIRFVDRSYRRAADRGIASPSLGPNSANSQRFFHGGGRSAVFYFG